MPSTRASTLLVRSTAVLLLLAACSSPDTPADPAGPSGGVEGGTGTTSEAQPLASFDPPRRFDGDPVPITLDAVDANLAGDFVSRFVLAGDRAYGVSDGVGAVDLASGKTLWQTSFADDAEPASQGPLYDERGPGVPVLAEDGTTVLAAAAVAVPGSGTTKDALVLRVLALDADSGEELWHVDVPAPEDVTGTSAVPVRVVSASEGHVLVALDGDGLTTTGLVAAIDPVGHEVRWARDGALQAELDDALLVVATPDGSPYPQLTGVDPATGEELWVRGTDVSTSVSRVKAVETSAGAVVTATSYDGSETPTVVLDPRTGAVLRERADVVLTEPRYEGGRLYDSSGTTIRVLDPESLATVWQLPTEERVAPSHPVFYGGLVYGGVGDDLGVVLDGATGQDVTTDVPGTFVAVGEHGALVLRDGETFFLPATG